MIADGEAWVAIDKIKRYCNEHKCSSDDVRELPVCKIAEWCNGLGDNVPPLWEEIKV